MKQCDNHFGAKFPTPIVSEAKSPEAQLNIDEERETQVVTVSEKRSIRPTTYRVKEVIVAPSDQVGKVKTNSGDTMVAIQDQQQRAVVVGEQADAEVVERIEAPVRNNKKVPVHVVPEVQQQKGQPIQKQLQQQQQLQQQRMQQQQ